MLQYITSRINILMTVMKMDELIPIQTDLKYV